MHGFRFWMYVCCIYATYSKQNLKWIYLTALCECGSVLYWAVLGVTL